MGKSTSTAYTGAYLDGATGAYPLGNGYRWYLPGLMRFAAPDSLSPFSAGGVNLYAYCGADPINRSDPSGHFFEFFLGYGDEFRPRATAGDASISADRAVQDIQRGTDSAGPSTSRIDQLAGNAPRAADKNDVSPSGGLKRPATGDAGDGGPPAKRMASVPSNPEQFNVGAFMASELKQGNLEWHPDGGKIAATWHSPMSRLAYPSQVSEAILNSLGFVGDVPTTTGNFSLRRINTGGLDMKTIYSGPPLANHLGGMEPVQAPALYAPWQPYQSARLLSPAQLASAYGQAFTDRVGQWNEWNRQSVWPDLHVDSGDLL